MNDAIRRIQAKMVVTKAKEHLTNGTPIQGKSSIQKYYVKAFGSDFLPRAVIVKNDSTAYNVKATYTFRLTGAIAIGDGCDTTSHCQFTIPAGKSRGVAIVKAPGATH